MNRMLLVALVALGAAQGALGAATTAAPDCGSNPADIVFLLDSSGSVGSVDFKKQLDFVSRFVQTFDIGPRNVQIGVVTFATTPHNEFNLNTHPDKNGLVAAIQHINYISGGTRTDTALKYVKDNSFTKPAGDRDNVANILIVMTDGQSNAPAETVKQAAALHSGLNAKVFAIGIGAGVSTNELNIIATDHQHVFSVSSFDALSTLQAELKKTACTVDGGWTSFGSYSPCTKTCGGGIQFHERSCTNPPPANGGAQCVGQARETQNCNTQVCPTIPPPTTTTAPKTTHIPTTLASGCNGTEPADIVFILDASGSVGAPSFNKMLQFVNKMIDGFPIGAADTHIGVVTFDTKVYNQFHLNKFTDKAAIQAAVSAITYTGMTTHTDEAIKYARETSFSSANGMRGNAAKIAIIVTDGQSNNPAATASEAALLRQQGITVFAIGVGTGIGTAELNAMATDPDASHVFQVDNFNNLDTIKGTLSKKTCEVKATTMPPTTPPPKPDCEAQADITFLLDSSGSVGSANFQKMKTFVHDMMTSFNIGPNAVQVGVDTFHTTVKTEFHLNQYNDRPGVQAAINKIPYTTGGTNTAEAIKYMATDSFTAAHGDRPNVPNIAIVVTDGQSANPTLTAAEAKKARDAGITLLAIGVGSGIGRTELNAIATDPDSTHVYMADNFDALTSLKAMLSSKACEVSKPVVNSTKECSAKADILFILDSSGSIGAPDYQKMLTFVRGVVSKFDIGADKVRIGTEIFSDRTYIQFNLNQHMAQQSVDSAIANIPYIAGTTNTGQALKDAYTKMFTAANGDRADAPNIAIVVTDGRSGDRVLTTAEAQKLRNQGVQVFAVGVGPNVDTTELNAVATDPDNTHVLTVQDFSQLQQISASLNSKACAAIPPTGMSLTPVPGTTISPDACQDKNPNCRAYNIPAVCIDYAGWTKDNCQRSCGMCPSQHATPPPPCRDDLPNCNQYEPSTCSNPTFKPWAMNNCRQFCGFCSLGNQQQTLTGYFGSCYYNGKQYKQGEKWDDGCSYECTCDDASSGRYSCYNKCPLYFNLPPQCTLVNKGSCCLEPVCDFKGTQLTTNGQQPGTYNGVKVCMYKNTPYYQGQSWQDGCDKSCFCQDGSVGLYTCQSICAHYDTLPTECRLERPAGKCCEEPSCDFNKQYGQFTGAGTLSGHGAGSGGPTTVGPCVDKDANCAHYPPGTCQDPNYVGWAHEQCQKTCGYCPSGSPTPGPNDVCVYNGVSYHQGQRWDDGCDLECVCENAAYGFYRCQKKCADIVNLPLGCQQVKAVGDCCAKIQCTGTTGTFTGSQTVGGTIGGYPVPQPMPGSGTGMTGAPQTGNAITGKLNGCLYKGTYYAVGRRWDDGCDFTCTCEDPSQGLYKCTPKCPSFGSLPTGCTMQDNPNDVCCQQPVCAPGTTGTGGQPVVLVPTYGKGFTGFGPVVMPQVGSGASGMNPTLPPGVTGSMITGSGRGCVYNGRVYGQGSTWDQGCQYKCECVDANAGQYICIERCTVYTNIPPQCTLQPDPADSCCKRISCDFNMVVTTFAPFFAQTTPASGGAFCKYQGYYHRQGEVWNDGCGLTCRCEDAANHYYQCTDRCPKYDNVPATCSFVADPKDPQCCRVPQCQNAGGTVGTSGFSGSFIGYGRPQNILPSQLNNTGYSNKCLYKGQIYDQGQTWQDGCDFECECVDASRGMYRCSERCRRIAAVPNGCTFIQDPADACCQTLKCDPSAQFGTCRDALSNCASYGTYICGAQYKDWATQNCPQYCGYCGNNTNPLAVTAAPDGTCKDNIPNCVEYDRSVCSDAMYQSWALANCRKTCNLCSSTGAGTNTGTMGGTGTGSGGSMTGGGTGTGSGGTIMTGGSGTCQDKLTNCQEYTQAACTGLYVDWARENCARFCNLCGSGSGTSGNMTGFQTVAPGSGGFTGFSGGCIYKGNYYGAGDKWTDGCDYNCSCENGQTGFYRCTARCPTYQLPSGCVLRTLRGECCGVPDCTGGGTGTGIGSGTGTGSGTGGSMTGSQTGCVYKNTLYQQGQQWKDGCQYKCTCTDASSGQYSCAALCLTWNLPPTCHLDQPAPGKCCQTPNCPANVVLNYPPGYVPE